jgi:hypothetical protein
MRRHLAPRPGPVVPGTGTEQVSGDPQPAAGANGPIVILSYPYSGARHVQDILGADTDLVCTSGTGILPLCAVAAETWRRVEGQGAPSMSALAISSIRRMITAQVTVILADAGKARWCELAMAAPGAAELFLRIFPQASFVCVHRCCPDMIKAGVQASPWGLGEGLGPYLMAYPGNNVAALAAYWAQCAEELLAFEKANPHVVHRVRYDDVTGDPEQGLAALRASLRLGEGADGDAFPEQPGGPGPAGPPPSPGPEVPLTLIPVPLRERVSRLHAELGYATFNA